jgi:hypothetical protein
MLLRHEKLKAAAILLLVVTVATSGFTPSAYGACVFSDFQRDRSASKCSGSRCSCSTAKSEVRACCCDKREPAPAPSPVAAWGKVGGDLNWIHWAYPPAAVVADDAQVAREQRDSATNVLTRSIQSVLCIWRI